MNREEIAAGFRHTGQIGDRATVLSRAVVLKRSGLAAALAVLLHALAPGQAVAEGTLTLEEPPRYGIFYDTYEPTFYTGFAPRTRDPKRMQIHIGRGNQMRVTVVLADDVLRDYADDLLVRERTYRRLIEGGRLVLTQNRSFDEFERSLSEAGVARIAAEQEGKRPDERIEQNLRLLEKLNPGRVFRIKIRVADLVDHWKDGLRPEDATRMSDARELELLNAMLPTRLFIAETDAATRAELTALVRSALAADRHSENKEVRAAFVRLFERVSNGIYPVHDDTIHRDTVEFTEFTAIYPVGTWNQSTTVHGRPIPEYPTPGRRALTTHQRTLTIDHVPDDPVYSYSPWLPYMHVGTNMHNAIHTLFWKMKTSETEILPAAWKQAAEARGNTYLWLLSRGPMSHGCTHLNAGHIAELRELLPADVRKLADVDVYYNQSTYYDVFDINGDLSPEVMGVRYFIAYSLKDNKPDRLRVRNERHAYYDWLYAGELTFDGEDRGRFATVRDGRFAGRTAVPGREYTQIPLYEAEYEHERVQFYRKVDVDFTRALRTVGVDQPSDKLDAELARGRTATPTTPRALSR